MAEEPEIKLHETEGFYIDCMDREIYPCVINYHSYGKTYEIAFTTEMGQKAHKKRNDEPYRAELGFNLFLDKKTAVERNIKDLHFAIYCEQDSIKRKKKQLKKFESADFQMRFLGEILDAEWLENVRKTKGGYVVK